MKIKIAKINLRITDDDEAAPYFGTFRAVVRGDYCRE